MSYQVMLIAGEASGDLHGAKVAAVLQEKIPGIKLTGMAGPLMRQAGVDAMVASETMAVMGFFEVFANFKTIYQAYRKIKTALKKNPPQVLILIDYPGFNLRVAKLAKKYNIKVLYYVSPQIWAWKAKRIKKIKRYVDRMAVIFPFEVAVYQKAGIPVTYVGSPIAESLGKIPTKSAARELLGLDDRLTVALLPGSRLQEIKRMLPVMLSTLHQLAEKYPSLQCVLPVASTIKIDVLKKQIKQSQLDIQLVEHHSTATICASDVVISTSGTATLEAAFLMRPLVIVYKMFPLTYCLARCLIKIPYIGLCNIVAGKALAKELIQSDATPRNIAREVESLIENPERRAEQLDGFRKIKSLLSEKKSAEMVADLAINLFSKSP